MPRRATTRTPHSTEAGPPGASSTGTAGASLLDVMRALRRELRRLERDAGDGVGLPPAQAQVLRTLGERPAGTLAELADRTHTDPSSVSVVVQRLVDAGLVVRTVGTEDRRRTELSLTRAGHARLRRLGPTAEQRLSDAIQALGSKNAETLAQDLGRLVESLRESSDDEA